MKAIEYFHQVHAKLFGKGVLISRTGYFGERGYEIFVDCSEVVGQVTSPGYSHRLGRSLGLCHIRPDIQTGTVLQNVGRAGAVDVVVDDVPYHDPKKPRTHA